MRPALYVDLRNGSLRFAAVGPKTAAWSVAPGGAVVGKGLAKALATLGFRRARPSCVAVATGGEPGSRDVSWSTVRSGVAVGNTLAFAWHVPVVAVAIRGDETPAAVEEAVRRACAGAKAGEWVRAGYSGEPNITTPKRQ